jgi:hypothetical protein
LKALGVSQHRVTHIIPRVQRCQSNIGRLNLSFMQVVRKFATQRLTCETLPRVRTSSLIAAITDVHAYVGIAVSNILIGGLHESSQYASPSVLDYRRNHWCHGC